MGTSLVSVDFKQLLFQVFLTYLLLLYATHTNTCYVLLLLVTVPMYTLLSTAKYQNISYLVAIVDCSHIRWVAAASFENL